MPAMISASRCSVCSNVQESRLAFCCISRAEVATPPALAALPGPKATPASSKADHVGGGGHVRAFDHSHHTVADEGGGVSTRELVLGRARHGDVAGHVPDAAIGDELRVRVVLQVFADPAPRVDLDLLEQVQVQTALVEHVSLGVGTGGDGRSELGELSIAWMATLPDPDTTHVLPSRLEPQRAFSISSAKNDAP